MGLYGIYGSHTTEACPLNSSETRKLIIEKGPLINQEARNNNIKIVNQYHSALEHTFLWVVEADDAHLIQTFFATNLARFNSLKIVPLITFSDVIEHCKKL
ncbi:MAG: hypothetical protein MRJ93_07170 [Nitrososphaeraceae archaeon]|nr:hypothetical protein [Nitrososphaeraceae archaeon]